MDTTLEEQMDETYDNLSGWTTPPKKGMTFNLADDRLLFSNLEESARAIAQASILSYGIRFEPSAVFELYSIIEEGIVNIKLLRHENDISKIAEAKRNLVSYIEEIVTSARQQGSTTIDDKKVREIRKLQFCPVYPFT